MTDKPDKKPKGRILGDVEPPAALDLTGLKRAPVAAVPAEALKQQLRPAAAEFVSTRTKMPAQKLVKDAFALPAEDYALIGQAIARALEHRRALKKVVVIRAALHALAGLDDDAFLRLIDGMPELKSGPKN